MHCPSCFPNLHRSPHRVSPGHTSRRGPQQSHRVGPFLKSMTGGASSSRVDPESAQQRSAAAAARLEKLEDVEQAARPSDPSQQDEQAEAAHHLAAMESHVAVDPAVQQESEVQTHYLLTLCSISELLHDNCHTAYDSAVGPGICAGFRK